MLIINVVFSPLSLQQKIYYFKMKKSFYLMFFVLVEIYNLIFNQTMKIDEKIWINF